MPKTDTRRFFVLCQMNRNSAKTRKKSWFWLQKMGKHLGKYKTNNRHNLVFHLITPIILWRWRESNPRPNKEPPWFLHAYSAVGFRDAQGSERPKRDLISWVSPWRRSADRTIPKLISTSFSGRNQESPPARCLVRSPCGRIKPVIYCASIRQRERSCFRQLLFCS